VVVSELASGPDTWHAAPVAAKCVCPFSLLNYPSTAELLSARRRPEMHADSLQAVLAIGIVVPGLVLGRRPGRTV
jgi:hypothetical protein